MIIIIIIIIIIAAKVKVDKLKRKITLERRKKKRGIKILRKVTEDRNGPTSEKNKTWPYKCWIDATSYAKIFTFL